jgi:hypothetical protein
MIIVQIGTNDGNDDVKVFVKDNQLDIKLCILVEPLSELNAKILENYKGIDNVYVENVAIVSYDDTEEQDFFYEQDSDNYQVSSLISNHTNVSVKSVNPVVSRKIKVLSINNLFEKYDLHTIDCLYIDAEGLDVDIINSIDFTKFIIKKIVFESAHSDGNWTKADKYIKLIEKLKLLNYDVQELDVLNTQATLK